ncbi:MAG: DUF655 domain-containing protein [Candidatus Hodarchaeota archaeon]
MERDKKSHTGKGYERKQGKRRDRSRTPVKLIDPITYVLDFLSQGRGIGSPRREPLHPIVYALGTKYFSILEIHFKEATISIEPQEKLNLENHRTEISQLRQLEYLQLSNEARLEVPDVINKIVYEEEKRFIEFFNTARPITNRLHQLRLLPGIGETRMWDILEARKKAEFESYQDLKERTKISNPQRLISTRILEEIERDEKHLLFVRKKRERTNDHSSRRSF